ncbi:hypothetical protein ACDX78_01650 [Virgibacillus oceani]
MSNNKTFTNGQNVPVNIIHDEAIIQRFIDGIGSKVFVLIPNFPFIFIGTIKEVIDDHAIIFVETTSQAPLEKREWNIHIHSIEVFYIERSGGPKIPELKE